MKKSATKKTFTAWSAPTRLAEYSWRLVELLIGFALLYALAGCVTVVDDKDDLAWSDSSQVSTFAIDSLAIYRCDTCRFARSYRAGTESFSKPCPKCNWEKLPQRTNDRGRLQSMENPTQQAMSRGQAPPVARYADEVQADYQVDSARYANANPQQRFDHDHNN